MNTYRFNLIDEKTRLFHVALDGLSTVTQTLCGKAISSLDELGPSHDRAYRSRFKCCAKCARLGAKLLTKYIELNRPS
jgi:hypothetical protein